MTDDAWRAELEQQVAERLAACYTAWHDDDAKEHDASWLAVARESLAMATRAWDAAGEKHIEDARAVHRLNHADCHKCGMIQWEASTHYLSAALGEEPKP